MIGMDSIERSLDTTRQWVGDVRDELDLEDDDLALGAMGAVLHALRDRLTVDEAADLAAQLPMVVRGIYYHGYKPSDKPLKIRETGEFLQRVEEEVQPTGSAALQDPERVTRGVLAALSRRISDGQAEHARQMFPADLQGLWP